MTAKQTQAAKRNIKKAQKAASQKRTIAKLAKQKQIPGRSKMGKWDLIKAIRKAG